MTDSLINKIAFNVETKFETPEEFLSFHKRELLLSDNWDRILFLFYSDFSVKEFLDNIYLLIYIQECFPKSKIYILCKNKNTYFSLYKYFCKSNFRFIQVKKYFSILKLIEKYNITKYVYRKYPLYYINAYKRKAHKKINLIQTTKTISTLCINNSINLNDISNIDYDTIIDENTDIDQFITYMKNSYRFYGYSDFNIEYLAPFFDVDLFYKRDKLTHPVFRYLNLESRILITPD